MKDFLSDLGKLLFTGIGLVQTIVTVILVIVVAGYYNFSYKNLAQTEKVLAETVQCCSGTPECGDGKQCVTGTDPSCTLQGKGVCEDMPGPAQGCCKTKADCAPWEECRISNAACGPGGLSCGIKQEKCKANGDVCGGNWECCSGNCKDNKVCSGAGGDVPVDINCSVSADGVTFKNKGTSPGSRSVSGFWCQSHRKTKAECLKEDCSNSGPVTANSGTLQPGESKTVGVGQASCGTWQIDFSACSPNSDNGCEWDDTKCGPTPTPTRPPSTPTPTSRPTPTHRPTPTTTPRPSSTPTPTGISTPTPTPTATPVPSLPSCGDFCTSNWNGSPQNNGECPESAPTCWAFSTTEWRCVIDPDWDDHGCRQPILSCYNECDHDDDCRNGLYCQEVSGVDRCVNPDCSDESDCTCNRSCWDVCGHDSECPSGLSCLQVGETKRCVNSSCQLEEDCSCEAEPTPTPTKPAVLGAVAPKIIPKSGTPTELTSGLIRIGIAGILLRVALLLI